MDYIATEFSVDTIRSIKAYGTDTPLRIRVESLSLDEAREWVHSIECKTCLANTVTATIIYSLLEVADLEHRDEFEFSEHDSILVAQYPGSRLPDGTKALPTGTTISWILVTIGSCFPDGHPENFPDEHEAEDAGNA
jgi:hypothetical protein